MHKAQQRELHPIGVADIIGDYGREAGSSHALEVLFRWLGTPDVDATVSVYPFSDQWIAIMRVNALEFAEEFESDAVTVEKVHEEVASREMTARAVLDKVAELRDVIAPIDDSCPVWHLNPHMVKLGLGSS